MNRKGKGVTSDMSERKWTRRTWDGRLEILNYPFSEKALTSLGKDGAMELAKEIFDFYQVPAPPNQWEGKAWVDIETREGLFCLLCDSMDDARSAMDSIADTVESGKSVRLMLRRSRNYTYAPSYRIIPASHVTLISMSKVEEVKR